MQRGMAIDPSGCGSLNGGLLMEWVLIVAMWSGTFSPRDSTALTSIGGFSSEDTCRAAGKLAVKEFTTAMKAVAFVCVKK